MKNFKAYLKGRMQLTDWIHQARRGLSPSTNQSFGGLETHLTGYLWEQGKRDCPLRSIDASFCEGFLGYLTHAPNARAGQPRPLKASTQKKLFAQFETLLNKAVHAGEIKSNPCRELDSAAKPKVVRAERHYLSREEIELLKKAPCRNEAVKNAFLFCCFCGLRWSDVKSLQWEHLQRSGNPWTLAKCMVKTRDWVFVPIGKSAREFLPPQGGKGSVFMLPTAASANAAIHEWATAAGLVKKISFHSSRHTFATLLLSQGADIYTTSKLLGHKDLSTTQIYAQIIDRKKVEAIQLLDGLF